MCGARRHHPLDERSTITAWQNCRGSDRRAGRKAVSMFRPRPCARASGRRPIARPERMTISDRDHPFCSQWSLSPSASVASRADADPASIKADDVAKLQLPPATAINLAVHHHIAADDGLFHVSTGVEEPGELQKLPEANDLTADRDVIDRSRIRHARNASRPVGRPVRQRTPQTDRGSGTSSITRSVRIPVRSSTVDSSNAPTRRSDGA